MQTISCIIIDDEPLARKGLKEYINDVDSLLLEAEFSEPVKAMGRIVQQKTQLVFLDIQMPGITGLELMRTLQHPPPVIFTTAYPQYALDGFELNALDYLLKPISFERFLKAITRVQEYYALRNQEVQNGDNDYFFIRVDNRMVKVFYEDIVFIEAVQNYVLIHTLQKKYLTYLTFKSVEEYLPSNRFIKTHKSYIVDAAKIENIEGNEISIGHHRIPISRSCREEVMEKVTKGKILKR